MKDTKEDKGIKDDKKKEERKSREETDRRNKGYAKPKSRSGSTRTQPKTASGARSVTTHCAPLPPPLVRKLNTMSGKKIVPSLSGPTGNTSSSSFAELRKWQETQMTGLGIPTSNATPGTIGGVVMVGGTQ